MNKKLHKSICDEKLFSSIYNKYIQDLNDFLYYKYGSLLNPEDKAQEAFIKLWQNCAKVSSDKAKSYLFTVANNLMLNEVKHQKVVLKHQSIKSSNTDNENPEFVLEQKQYLEKYQKALGNLSEVQRVAFLLNRVEEKSHSEIAEMLGITLRATRKRIYNAVENLRKEIDGI
ncbi:RNA polymerase sigma factor [Geojedonia litorea]|uniref:RNA polymerase sigma factor n=1 Tax=Geojedonia litorea TaxID=1268269 RepID=A0ABV9N0C1_9FLAO